MLGHRPAGFEFFDHDPHTGITTWFRHEYDQSNPDNSRNVFAYTQDVAPVLDRNKSEQRDARGSLGKMSRIGAHAARIPEIIIEKWKTEHNFDLRNMRGPEDDAKLAQLLNDPDYRHLRVEQFNV